MLERAEGPYRDLYAHYLNTLRKALYHQTKYVIQIALYKRACLAATNAGKVYKKKRFTMKIP